MEFLLIVALLVGVAELKTVDVNLPGAVQKSTLWFNVHGVVDLGLTR